MKKTIVLALALLATPAIAQQQPPPDPALLQKAIGSFRAQRNTALDEQAVAEARAALLTDEVAKLRARIGELEAQAQSKPPAAPKE